MAEPAFIRKLFSVCPKTINLAKMLRSQSYNSLLLRAYEIVFSASLRLCEKNRVVSGQALFRSREAFNALGRFLARPAFLIKGCRKVTKPGIVAAALLLSACSGDPGTGAKEVKWDRDACERCRMVLSDRVHSAQMRFYPEGKTRSKVLMFDDIGCAALWLEDKPFKDDPRTEIWVTDHRNGQWIDARKATYIKGQLTPMEYGLGAQSEMVEGGLNYQQAIAHIHDVEERFNAHGVDLLERFRALNEKREADRKAKAADNQNYNSGETDK